MRATYPWCVHFVGCSDIVFDPLSLGIESMRISVSGLDNAESIFLKRFCKAIGLVVPELFTKKGCTHLVCPSREGKKFEKAMQWGVPIVDQEWVYRLATPKSNTEAGRPGDMTDPQGTSRLLPNTLESHRRCFKTRLHLDPRSPTFPPRPIHQSQH